MEAEPAGMTPGFSVGTLLRLARTRTGVLALATGGNFVVRTASSIVLTRLLTPNDFGIIGIISSVFVVVSMVTDLGFEAFLIRHHRSDERHFRDVLWTIHAQRGFALFAAVALASPLISWALGKPAIAVPLAVASLILLMNGLASLSLITALRHDKSRELSLFDFGLQVFQTVTCVLLALWWRNAWAMIAAMILTTSARTLLSFWLFADGPQRPARDRIITREFLAFSRVVLASSSLTLLTMQSDKLVLARLFTLNEFGLYGIALTIASAPAGFGEIYLRRIVLPIYSQAWRGARSELRQVYYGVRRLQSGLYGYACGGLIGAAPLLVAVLYDPRYAAAATFISLLMVSTALRFPNVAASELLIASGDMKGMLAINIVRVVWLVIAIPAGFLMFGALGVVGAVGLVEGPAMFYCWWLLRRAGILRLTQELSYLGLTFAGAASGFLISSVVLGLFPTI